MITFEDFFYMARGMEIDSCLSVVQFEGYFQEKLAVHEALRLYGDHVVCWFSDTSVCVREMSDIEREYYMLGEDVL